LKSRKIKILFIITGLKLGGAEILLLNLVKNINREIFDCSVLYLKGKPDIEEEFQTLQINVFNNSIYSIFNPLKYLDIYNKIKENNIEIIHSHLIQSNLLARIIGRIAGVRSIINSEHNTSNWKSNNFILFNIYKYTLRYVDIIHCISNSVKEHMLRVINDRSDKIRLIYNGVEVEKFKSKQVGVKKTLSLEKSFPIIGSISRFDKRKGIEYLIKATKLLKTKYVNVKLVLIGDGEEKRMLLNLIKKLEIEEQVLIIGKTIEVEKYLSVFDVFVLPSLQEGLSIAIIEAMASRIPVVASNVDGIPEVISHNHDGILVNPKDETEIFQAVTNLLEDEKLKDALVNNAYGKVVSKFNIKKIVREFELLYVELTKK
jgi:glycosyltransferase involved in cell wall biosynthesis